MICIVAVTQDKWRNLLKASGMQEQGSEQVMSSLVGESKHNTLVFYSNFCFQHTGGEETQSGVASSAEVNPEPCL